MVVVQWTIMHSMPTVLVPQQSGKHVHLGGHVMSQQVHDGGQHVNLHHLGGHVISQHSHDGGQHVNLQHLGGHVISHQVHDGGQHVQVGHGQVGQGHLIWGGHVMQQNEHDGGQIVQDSPLTWTRQHGLGPMPIAGGHEQVNGVSHGLNIY